MTCLTCLTCHVFKCQVIPSCNTAQRPSDSPWRQHIRTRHQNIHGMCLWIRYASFYASFYASLCGNLCGIFHLMAASDKNHWLFRNTRRHCARPLTIPVLQEVPGISLSLDVNIEHIATHLKTITSFGHPKAIAIPYHLHIDTFPSAAS